MVKFGEVKKYLGVFVVAVLIIAVYKAFDSIGVIFSAVIGFITMLSPIFAAFIIAFLMYPMCYKVEVLIEDYFPPFFSGKARTLSVVGVYVVVLAALAGVIYILVPTLAKNFVEFLKMLPNFAEIIVDKLNKLPYINIKLSEIDHYIDFKKFLHESGWLRMEIYTSGLIGFSNSIINIVLSVITSVYILIDRKSLAQITGDVAKTLWKGKKNEVISMYVKRGIEFSYKYLFCVIVDAVIVFAVSLGVMTVMKIKYAPVLAFTLGLFNIVPYFGAIVAGGICVMTAIITSGFSNGIILGVLIIAIQQIDANIIQPHLIRGNLNVKPFWVLVGILVGGYVFGIWGVVGAVPALALIRTIAAERFASLKQNKK